MTETAIQPAQPELLALAKAMRPEWDTDTLAAAFIAAKNAGWTWTRTFTETCRLLTDEDAGPRDLRAAAASPVRRDQGPGDWERGAAMARDLLAAREPQTASTGKE